MLTNDEDIAAAAFQSVVDWFTIISAVGSVLAIFAAVGAILYSAHQAKNNAQMIADERHTALQLELLEDLIDEVNVTMHNTGLARQRARAAQARLRIVDAPLPYTRVRFAQERSSAGLMNDLGIVSVYRGEIPDDEPTNLKSPNGESLTVRQRLFDELCEAMTELANATPAQIRAMRSAAAARRESAS